MQITGKQNAAFGGEESKEDNKPKREEEYYGGGGGCPFMMSGKTRPSVNWLTLGV